MNLVNGNLRVYGVIDQQIDQLHVRLFTIAPVI